MTPTFGRYAPHLVRAALWIAAFAHWGLRYPCVLAWQEQFQLFLFDADYLASRLALPGGAAAYVGEFLLQFYNNPYVGAAIAAALFVALHALLCAAAMRCAKAQNVDRTMVALLATLPVAVLWISLADENLLPALPVSVCMALGAYAAAPSSFGGRAVYAAVGVPVVYWLAGPAVAVFALLVGIDGLVRSRRWQEWALAVGAMVWAVVCVVAGASFVPYPLRGLACGIFFYRQPDVLALASVWLGASAVVVAALGGALSAWLGSRWPRGGTVVLCVVAVACVAAAAGSFDEKKYELMEYDTLVRSQRWDDIIALSERTRPDLPMSVAATNLALAMRGELCDRAFDFYQNGTNGLFPPFVRDYRSLQLTGEIFFQLGLVNTAQRYAFEAMESIPNYAKSARVLKRLAETNIINGNYTLARKYLRLLGKTLFYTKWAASRLALIDNPESIDAHPLYGKMRRLRLQEDFLFSDAEIDKTCGKLFGHNIDNRPAMQYLLIWPLLRGDLQTFMSYYEYVSGRMPFSAKICQEAVALAYAQNNSEPPQGLVSGVIINNMRRFAQAYSSAGKNAALMQPYRNTLWYYLLVER